MQASGLRRCIVIPTPKRYNKKYTRQIAGLRKQECKSSFALSKSYRREACKAATQTVCPLPPQWHDIYQRLLAAWETSGRDGVAPPKPLILAGWAHSNDADKKRRWKETVAWANNGGLDSVLQRLSPDHFYTVAELTTYDVGPMGGPMYLPWSFDEKKAPDPETANEALALLKDKWASIVGAELASATRPLLFSGAKSRRLVVLAKPNVSPPWGSWSQLPRSEARRAFTKFRAAVNRAMHPLEVDHIDFVHVKDV